MAADPLQLAREVYTNAALLFAKQHTTDERKRFWINQNHSLKDIEAAVLAAKSQYEGRTHSRVRKALAGFSATFMYYSKIGDTFAQHHPEYTSLAWGTMKLLFVLVLNHEETLTKLAESLTSIAETLPRVDMHLNLYPMPIMKRNVEELYALLIKFYHRTLRWYSAGPLKHLVMSLTRPHSLEFADITAQMETRARSIDNWAVAMAHDELRTMLQLVKGGLEEQKRLRTELERVLPVLSSIHGEQHRTEKQVDVIHQLILDHQNVNSAVLRQTHTATLDMQIAMMINETKAEYLLAPHESLQKRLAIHRRRLQTKKPNLNSFWKAQGLTVWNQAACSSLLIVRGTILFRDEIDSAAALMTDLVSRETTVPIIWALKSARAATPIECSITDLIKYLAMQALQLDPVALGNKVSASFNASRFASTATKQEWMEILTIILSSFPVIYIVIDVEFMGAFGREEESLQLLLQTIQSFVLKNKKTVIKIAVLSYRKTALAQATANLPTSQQTYLAQLGKPLMPATTADLRMLRRTKGQLAFKKDVAMHGRNVVSS